MGVNDFNRQMEEAWEKITGSSTSSLSVDFERDILNTRQEIAMESVQILRSRYRREKEYWSDLFQKKEIEIKTLHEKLSAFEKELSDVQKHLDDERVRSVERLKSDIDSFQDKHNEFAQREESFRKELLYYNQSAEEAHANLALEKNNFIKLRDAWKTKETEWEHLIRDREEETAQIRQEYAEKELELFNKQKTIEEDKDGLLLEVNRLKSALESERRHGEETSKDSTVKINEFRADLDNTYKQLEMEKKLREVNINEFKQYQSEIHELKNGRQRMLEEWDKERASWKELWDKERLLWEQRKDEIVEWEKRLRQERERWILSGVPEPEKLLKEFFQPPTAVPAVPGGNVEDQVQKAEKKPYLRPILAATWNAVLLKKRTRMRRVVYGGFFAITVLIAFTLYFRGREIYPLPQITPATLGFDSKQLVVFDKTKSSMFFYAPSKMNLPVRSISMGNAYEIDSLVFAGGLLWTCDTQGKKIRLHRTKNPKQLEGTFPTPGSKTTLIAWDGNNVWTYDAIEQKIILHKKDPVLSVHKKYDLPDVDPSALCWWKDSLWIYDRLTHEIVKYKINGDRLVKDDSYFLSKKLSLAPIRDVTGISFIRGGLWICGGKEKKLVRYNFNRVKLYNLPF